MDCPKEFVNDPEMLRCWNLALSTKNGWRMDFVVDAEKYIDVNRSNVAAGFECMWKNGCLEWYPVKLGGVGL